MRVPKRVVIIGAGISGLSVACGLAGRSDIRVTLLEADRAVGGLSKTISHRGIRFDIGPHRFSPQLPEVVRIVKSLMGDSLIVRANTHGVHYDDVLYRYPPRLRELLNPSSLRTTLRFGSDWVCARLKNVAWRFCGGRAGASFEEILLDNFGRSFCDDVIFPMIYKVWGTRDLHADFARIRFVKPTFPLLTAKLIGRGTNANNHIFYYPRGGYGEIGESLRRHIEKSGHVVELGARIASVATRSLKGPFTVRYALDGVEKALEADILVNTISNRHLIEYLKMSGTVDQLLTETGNLTSRTLRLGVLLVKGFSLPARVVIFPEARFIFNRISEMNQFADLGYPAGVAVLLVDVICAPGSDYDLMDEGTFNHKLLDSLLALGWFTKDDLQEYFSLRFPDTYPVLDRARYHSQEIIDAHFARSAVILCGREASSDYNNMHNAIGKGLTAADYIAGTIDFDDYERSSRILGRLPIQD